MKLSMHLLYLSVLVSTPAWALFDVQVMTGKRNTTFKSSGVSEDGSGTELKAAAHLDPIPLVPIGFGISVAQTSWDKLEKSGYQKVDGFDLGLEVEAWLPLQVAGLVPYAKIGYTVAGAYAAKLSPIGGDEPSLLYKPSGLYLAAGLRWEFLLRLGVMFEVEKATRTLAFDKVTDLGSIPTGTITGKDIDADSLSLLIGVQAGI